MSTVNPFFSIIIPSKNRGNLLGVVLRTAIAQTFHDFEIVVSDNCSTDNTRDVALGFGDKRIRYVRSDKPLTMVDSWEFASHQARGRFVTFLGDDDGVTPNVLSRIAGVLNETKSEVVSWNLANFYHASWFEVEKKSTLEIVPFTNEVCELEAEPILRDFVEHFRYCGPAPRMFQCVCSSDLVERIRTRTGRFYHDVAPDSSALIGILSTIKRFYYVDYPYFLYGYSRESNRPNGMVEANSTCGTYFNEIDSAPDAKRIPLSAPLLARIVAQTFVNMRDAPGNNLQDFNLGWDAFLLKYYGELVELRSMGLEITNLLAEFDTFVAQQPAEVQARFRAAISLPAGPIGALRRKIRSVINATPGLRKLEMAFRRPDIIAPRVLISGAEAGFTDIASCARVAETFFDKGYRALVSDACDRVSGVKLAA